MFTRIAAVSSLALACLAAPATTGMCSNGPIQCCNSIESANSDAGSALLALLGVVLQDTTAKIGLECSAIAGVGIGGGDACQAQAVCCEDNNVGGLVSVGCVPVSL